jgi:phosphoribosylamine--glycine ligase
MKVLFIDVDGVCVDMAVRSQWAGHQCKVFISPQKCDNIGKGLVTRVNDWEAHMDWADLIVMTGVGKYMRKLDAYFAKGYPILGTNWDAAQLEIDRECGMDCFERADMDCLPYQSFTSLDDGIAHVKKTKGTYVSKPLHDHADKSTSYVSSGPDDMIFMMEKWKKQSKNYPFILQEKLDLIGEVGVSGWFGPGGWCGVWEEDFEHKKLMPGGIGPNTGEMGNVCKYVDDSKLAQDFLLPLTDTLHALKFVGNFAMGLLVPKHGPLHPSECTARLGWPITFMQTHLHKQPMVEFFADLVHGKDALKVRRDHTCGVVMGIKPFPYESFAEPELCEGYPLLNITQEDMDHVHLGQVRAGKCLVGDKLKEQDVFVTAGCYVACVVDRGRNVLEACDRAFERTKNIRIPNSPLYRNDIGHKLADTISALQKKGYCEEWVNG